MTERELADAACASQLRRMLGLLMAMRHWVDALDLPVSESAAELRQGLDIAWVGARRLYDEASGACGDGPSAFAEDDRRGVVQQS